MPKTPNRMATSSKVKVNAPMTRGTPSPIEGGWNEGSLPAEDFSSGEPSTWPPMPLREAYAYGGQNAAKYIQPCKRDVPCEDSYYFWAEPECLKIYQAMPYDLICDFTAQAMKHYIKQNPQEFLSELSRTMIWQDPFSMEEFCMHIAIRMLADFMFVPGKKLEEAIRNKEIIEKNHTQEVL